MNSKLRTLVLCLLMLALVSLPSRGQPTGRRQPVATPMQVYKTPTCGCCAAWVDHVKAAGFAPDVHEAADLAPVKSKGGVPPNLQSCHTAMIAGYVVEGHVPADVIRQLLEQKPNIAGIAVPGMPIGSPGMEMGARKDAYEVIAFTKDGKTSVFARRP